MGLRARLLAYCEYATSIRTFETWFPQFKIGDFNVKDSECTSTAKNSKSHCMSYWMMAQRPLSQETVSTRLGATKKI